MLSSVPMTSDAFYEAFLSILQVYGFVAVPSGNLIKIVPDATARQYAGPIGNSQYRGYAKDIRSSGTHLLSLINDILDLSKVEANRFELHEENVDLVEALHSIFPIIQERMDATLDLLAAGHLSTESLITHHFPAHQAPDEGVRGECDSR